MQNNNNITLHFKTLNKQSFQINSINPNTTTLTQLKELIAKQEHFDLNSIKLVYKGKDYSDPSFQNLLLLNFPFVSVVVNNPLNSSSSSTNNHAKEVIIVVAKKVQPQKKNSGNNLEGDQLSLSSSSSLSNKQQQKQQQHSDREDNTTNTTSIPIHFQNKKTTTTNNTTNTNNNTTFNHKKMGNTIMGNDESTTSTTNNNTASSSTTNNNNNNTAQNLAPKLTREEQSLLQINAIENEAKKYQEAIQELKGKKGNTELLEENKYNFEKRKLDEYLTRCMLKLDAVEIPNDEIRNKRRMTIQFIQKVIKTIEEEL